MSLANFNKEDAETLVALIRKTHHTLQRNKKATSEIKRVNAKTIQGTSQHFLNKENLINSFNSTRLTESLNYTSESGKTSRHSSFYTLNPKSINNDSALEQCLAQNSLPNMSTPLMEQASPSKRKLQTPEKSRKTTPVSNNKLRSIIFRTLDRVLHVQTNKSQPSPNKVYLGTSKVTTRDGQMGLDTLQRLNDNVNDTPSSSLTRSIKYENVLTARQISVSDCENSETSSNTIPSIDWKAKTLDDSESDDVSWTYVQAPLQIVETTMEDSLQYSEANCPISSEAFTRPNKNGSGDGDLVSLEDSKRMKKQMFVRKPSKSENKVRKRCNERQLEKKVSTDQPEYLVEIPQEKPRRPDSPIKGQPAYSRVQSYNRDAKPLVNLSEESFETISLSSCDTNSFMRKMSSQPSSTLVKKSKNANFDHVDTNSSTSSSFCSFQMSETCVQKKDNKLCMLPSTLCPETQVMPISVPVRPWQNANVCAVNGELNVRELSEKFIPSKEQVENDNDLIENVPLTEAASLGMKNGNQIEQTMSSYGIESESTLLSFDTDRDRSQCTNDKPCTSVISTGSIAPPPPPLPDQDMTSTYRNLQVFPMKVFTSVNSHKSIFKQMVDIPIEAGAVQKLRDQFPLKKATSTIDGSFPVAKLNEQESSSKIPFKLNIEIYLKKWNINCEAMVQSIKTLDVREMNSEAITTLNQVIPKNSEVSKVDTPTKSGSVDQIEQFIGDLMSINRLNEKVKSMTFSVNFNDDFTTLSRTVKSFIDACDSISTSEKFQVVINVILAFLKQWKSDGLSTICGFDIQGLTNLARKVSDDGSTNVLRMIIEYMFNEPSHTNSLDFYKDFFDFSEVGKTSVKAMMEKHAEMQENLENYENEYNQIMNNERENKNEFSFDFAKSFIERAKQSINILNESLKKAQQKFSDCKERYCLTNSDISEVDFFASLSKFVSICQMTHNQIIQNLEHKNKKQEKENVEKLQVKKRVATPKLQSNFKSRRKLEPPTRGLSIFNGNPDHDLDSLLTNQEPNVYVGPQIRNRRQRKSEIIYV